VKNAAAMRRKCPGIVRVGGSATRRLNSSNLFGPRQDRRFKIFRVWANVFNCSRPSSRKARLAVGLIRPLTFWDSDRTHHFKRCSWFLNLTRRADIKLNKRVLLRRPLELLTLSQSCVLARHSVPPPSHAFPCDQKLAGWLHMHESGTYVKLTATGPELYA